MTRAYMAFGHCESDTGAQVETILAEENARLRKAGCDLAEAAARVIRDYDGIHRLSLATAAWFSAVAGEGDRSNQHAR